MNTFWKIIATTGGAGYAPVAPGTAGAILASAVAFFMQSYFSYEKFNILLLIFIAVFTFLGIVAANKLQNEWGKDPGKIVVDELVGQWITFLFIPFGWKYILIGLVLFRFFDILKPLFIKKLESLPGGLGVMADDILAGVYANIVLQLLIIFVL